MNSIWLNSKVNKTQINELKENMNVDILIIGGGIAGLSSAYHLRNTKAKVILVEKNLIGAGVSAKTTGKLTLLQDRTYYDLLKTYDYLRAKTYLKSQLEAIKIAKDIINRNHINCSLEKEPSYLFTNKDRDIKKLLITSYFLKLNNIKPNFIEDLPDGLKVKKGFYVDNTYTFNPYQFLNALKEIICKKIKIYEHTKVIDIRKKEVYYCYTDKYLIKAKKVIIATNYPFFIYPLLAPIKFHLEKAYLKAYPVAENLSFSAINFSKPTLSIRYYNNYKIVLKESHNIAFKNNDPLNFSSLKDHAKYCWSNRDVMTFDRLPYIGEIRKDMYIITGFNTWGMTNGILSGKIISDLINNKYSEYQKIFNPKRLCFKKKIIFYPYNIISSAKALIGTALFKNKAWYNKVYFKNINGKSVGIYVDNEGIKHMVYNKCPHLKCNLIFNEIEKTWDCPCHGSRFNVDGISIEGPSNYNITYDES